MIVSRDVTFDESMPKSTAATISDGNPDVTVPGGDYIDEAEITDTNRIEEAPESESSSECVMEIVSLKMLKTDH